MAVSPDFSLAVIWTEFSFCYFLRLPSLSYFTEYVPIKIPASRATNKVTFSSDSTLVII